VVEVTGGTALGGAELGGEVIGAGRGAADTRGVDVVAGGLACGGAVYLWEPASRPLLGKRGAKGTLGMGVRQLGPPMRLSATRTVSPVAVNLGPSWSNAATRAASCPSPRTFWRLSAYVFSAANDASSPRVASRCQLAAAAVGGWRAARSTSRLFPSVTSASTSWRTSSCRCC